MSEPTFYEVLGVPHDATPTDVKRAWRKLVGEHHPDREGGDDEKFKAVQEAYECLSDPTRRAVYDDSGIDSGHASLKVDALDVVNELVSECLEKEVSDPLDHARSVLMGNADVARCLGDDARAKQVKLLRYRGRFKKRLPGDNLFERLIDKRLLALATKIKEQKRAELVTAEALRILDDYETLPEGRALPYKRTVLQGLIGARL